MVQIIKTGIPNTAMRRSDISTRKANTSLLFAFHGLLPSHLRPRQYRSGKALFEGKGGCLSCHRVKDKGFGSARTLLTSEPYAVRLSLKRSLLEPNAEVLLGTGSSAW